MRHVQTRSTRLAAVALGTLGLSAAMSTSLPAPVSASPVAATQVSQATAVSSAAKKAAPPARAAARYNWGKAVAGDEFTYKGKPASSKWGVYDSAGHDGKGKRAPSAWSVDGNVATVTGNSRGVTGGMSSHYNAKYGRWEARMKTNVRDVQYHPNLMLWPEKKNSHCPEVDFAESTTNTKLVKFFLHYGCKPSQTSAAKAIDQTKWHNYAVEWTPSHITGYIDGVAFFKDTNRGHQPSGKMHLAAQLDWFVSGHHTPKKTTMSIAWVRIYKV
jgi:hypothetical protein